MKKFHFINFHKNNISKIHHKVFNKKNLDKKTTHICRLLLQPCNIPWFPA